MVGHFFTILHFCLNKFFYIRDIHKRFVSNPFQQCCGSKAFWHGSGSLFSLKGTVSRDFFAPVFFLNQLILVLLEMSKGRFDFKQIFTVVVLLKQLPGTLETGELPKISWARKLFQT